MRPFYRFVTSYSDDYVISKVHTVFSSLQIHTKIIPIPWQHVLCIINLSIIQPIE
jgi:hypothetical protein